jgi:hypothetical protein
MHLQSEYKSLFGRCGTIERCGITVTNSSESFIPIQRIINDKVKLTFNDYPEEAGITESTTKKKM